MFYNACHPPTPYNVASLVQTRDVFLKGEVLADFIRSHDGKGEFTHQDCRRGRKYILSEDGERALCLRRFAEEEDDLTEGQREMRTLANIRPQLEE